MHEEKQLENAQEKAAEVSENLKQVESEPMSAETNLPTDPEANLEDTGTVQATNPSEEFFPELEVEPFDLSPEDSTSVSEQQPMANAQAASLQTEVEELNQRLEALKSQLEDRNGQYMRLAADFENYRKRTQKEKEDQEDQVKCSTVKELLPVVDNFERARSQIKPQTDTEMSIHKSYQSVYKQLVDALKKIGVSPMRSEGKEFDPNLHEAIMREHTDEHPEGTVLEELMRGYVLGDRVLRHAMVKVSAAPEPESSPEDPVSN